MTTRLLDGFACGPRARSQDGRNQSAHEVAPAVVARALADAALLDGWVGVPERREQAAQSLAIARQLDDPSLLVRALTACIDWVLERTLA